MKRPMVVAACLALLSPPGNALASGDPPEAGAEPARVCLRWQPSTKDAICRFPASLERATEDVLAHRVFHFSGTCDLTVQAALESDGRNDALTFRVLDAAGAVQGERVVNAHGTGGTRGDCSALIEPASLVLAMVVEAHRQRVTVHVSAPEPAPKPASVQGPSVRYASSVLARAAWGLLPGWAVAPGAEVGVLFPGGWWVLSDASFWPEITTESAGRGGKFWGWLAGMNACRAWGASRGVSMALCVGAHGGTLHGSGVGLDQVKSESRATAQVDGEARLAIPIAGPVSFTLAGSVACNLVRPSFVYLEGGQLPTELHRPSLLVPAGAIGISVTGGP